MKLTLPSVSIQAPIDEIARSIEQDAGKHGLLLVKDLPAAPFDSIRTLIRDSQAYADRLNQAYPKNLVYKDSHATGNGGPRVDLKRVLDLSPDRLQAIQQAEPALLQKDQSPPLDETLSFWESLEKMAQESLLPALAKAIGTAAVTEDATFNYRMVDYYKSPHQEEEKGSLTPPRCQEHRDFGSFTLIFTSEPGLQVQLANDWVDVPMIPAGSALLLFGWCTQIRSNDRIPAVLHQVRPDLVGERTSAVLFCAPKHVATPLEPVLRHDKEDARYVSGLQVGQLRGKMARKWRHAEGTLSKQDIVLEEEEIRLTKLKTQDDVVFQTLAVAK